MTNFVIANHLFFSNVELLLLLKLLLLLLLFYNLYKEMHVRTYFNDTNKFNQRKKEKHINKSKIFVVVE